MKLPPLFRCLPHLLLGSLCSTLPARDLQERLREDRPLICSHRAVLSNQTVENSLAGIRACVEQGVEMVEIDVAESSDGALFLLHDTTLDRTTTGSGPLSDQTSAGILNFFLKDSHERIPRFREALDLARETGLYLMLDVKSAALDNREFLETRRPRILVSDFPLQARAAVE